jgi:hypothetical protein
MAGWVIIGTLAAFGMLCVLWALFGWLFSGGSGGFLVCPDASCNQGRGFLRRYLWLRGMGLYRCPLYAADRGLSDGEKRWLEARGIVLYSPEPGHGIGADEIDGRNGDPPGCHQHRGVSEL